MKFFITFGGIVIISYLIYSLIDLVVLSLYIIWSMSLTQVFDKLGLESWKAYIPFYNIYLVVKKAGLKDIYLLGIFLPLFGKLGFISFYVYLMYISVFLAKRFGKKKEFLGKMLMAPPIYMREMGKDRSSYDNVKDAKIEDKEK